MDKQLMKLFAHSDESEKDRVIQILLSKIEKKGNQKKEIDVDYHIKKLQSLKAEYEKEYNFKVGDLICWKKGLKNKKVPEYTEPVIIIEMLEKPIFDNEEEAGSPYFKEPLNIKVGMLDADEEFLIFHYDKNRFEPIKK